MTASVDPDWPPGEDVRPPRQAALCVNAKSRRGAELFESAKKILVDGGLELNSATAYRDPRALTAAVRRLAESDAPLVIVGGGDGTFSSVVRYFAKRKSVLGVLPLGTGNAFARDIGILTLEQACDSILNGKLSKVDMGVVGDQHFVNVATVGVSTLVARGLDHGVKARWGKFAYIASLWRALAVVKPFKVRLEIGGKVHEFESLQVVVGNGRFHAGPFPVAPDASITGGFLSVYALASRRRRDFLRMALHMSGGHHVDLKEVVSYHALSGRLSCTPQRRVTVDGEICLTTPVEFRSLPHALTVAVPSDTLG